MKIFLDLEMYSDKNVKKALITVLTNPCFHSVCLYRVSNFFNNIHLSIFAKIVWYINRILFNVDIDYRANLAGGFKLIHGLGTVIGKDVESKGRIVVYQGVTIGGSGKYREYNGHIIDQPIIEDNVIIYTDAKVLGPVIIGPNNHINAGKIITEDMPARN